MNKKVDQLRRGRRNFPICLMYGDDVDPEFVAVAVNAINFTLNKALPETNGGDIFVGKLHNRKGLPPKPADYYEKTGFMKSTKKDKINGIAMLNEFSGEIWRKNDPHYDFFITNFGVYLPKIKKSNCIGMTRRGIAAIVSLKELNKLSDNEIRLRVMETIVFKQLGNLFGLPATSISEDKQKKNCPNKCVMKKAYKMSDYIVLTEDRMKTGEPFCEKCSIDIYRFLHPNIR